MRSTTSLPHDGSGFTIPLERIADGESISLKYTSPHDVNPLSTGASTGPSSLDNGASVKNDN